jgi:hypothetical protein
MMVIELRRSFWTMGLPNERQEDVDLTSAYLKTGLRNRNVSVERVSEITITAIKEVRHSSTWHSGFRKVMPS